MTLLEKLNAEDRFAAEAGIRLTAVSQGKATAVMEVGKGHLNGAGVCQGGAVFTLADLAMAAAANSHGRLSLSLGGNIVFHNPATEGDVLLADASEVVSGGRIAYVEVRVAKADGTHVATLTSTAYRKAAMMDFCGLM